MPCRKQGVLFALPYIWRELPVAGLVGIREVNQKFRKKIKKVLLKVQLMQCYSYFARYKMNIWNDNKTKMEVR